MARILRLGANDLRLAFKDRTNLFWMLVMPVVFILFFGSVIGGARGDGPSDVTIRLTVVDNDVSWLSRALVETLKGEDFQVVEVEADALLQTEGRTRTLVIPKGMADAVASGRQTTLFLMAEPRASDQATVVAEVHVVRALARLLGVLVETGQAVDVQPAGLQAGTLEADADRLAEIRRLLNRESLVRLETSFAGKGRAVPGGFGQAVPGMMTQFIIMMVMIAGAVYLTEEKLSGVLRRLAVGPFSPRTLIAGKVAGLVMLALVQAVFLIVVGAVIGRFRILGAEFWWGRSPVGLLLMIISFAVATAGITLFYGAVLSTPTQAGAVGWLSGMIMAGLGGCWWPLEIVPPWLRTAGHVFPTAWMMDGMHELVSFGKGLEAVLPEAGILLTYGVLFGALGARFLKVQP